MTTTWPAALDEDIRNAISHFSQVEGSILLALQTIQETFGYVPDSGLNAVAETCNVSRADVYGVFTYYSDLRSTPPAPYLVKVCLAEACQASGSDALVSDLKAELGLDVHAKSRNEDAEVQSVFCLGNCALGPAVLVNGQLIGRATTAKVRAAIGRTK
ncbi:MAG TPA: NAD(P)H-dependent oxidoreductase subunit E [Candidatus Nanopelagicaceae bacterium]|nr:NAD(P)H-dependent oxidoreductase subunit E [Candidatus Nanopelagicaceae bacterium]